MKRLFVISNILIIALFACAQKHVSFKDVEHWTTSQLKQYVGQTIYFEQPVYTCNNYRGTITASMHRVMSPTNQALPLSAEYNTLVTVNNSSTFTLTGLNTGDRMGQVIYGMVGKINSTGSVAVESYDRVEGTRADMEAGLPNIDLVTEDGVVVKHDLLICAANLEYYLVENLGTGYGPANASEHQKQRTKVLKALSKIRADIYGLVEIEQGQSALAEIAADLTRLTGRNYTYINDGGSASGSYTKSGYIYCSDVVRPYGKLINNNQGVNNRKKFQAFDVIASGERFIFTINHFKAKAGAANATGQDKDQGDGQGTYNYSRVQEAKSVLTKYNDIKSQLDEDILIMGDLNAYAMEDPITELRNGGMTDLHRYFHADSSYSYTYHGQAGYLDHALCNSTLLSQVTGMAAYHVNSDESDDYTYDSSNDQTMFRYSDHDPVLVGLKLGASFTTKQEDIPEDNVVVKFPNGQPVIMNADGGYFTITSTDGHQYTSGKIEGDEATVDATLPQGLYIMQVYANGHFTSVKYFVW